MCECKCHYWDSGIITHDQPCCDWSLEKNIRPWGRYDILYNGNDCKVKRITVNPGKRLSYQCHHKRAEHWTVVSGYPTAILDDVEKPLWPGAHIFIDKGVKHRIENQWDQKIVFIEVQTGEYFGEDDIVRLEDDYGRK